MTALESSRTQELFASATKAFQQERYVDSIALFQELLALKPNNITFKTLLGIALLKAHRLEESALVFDAILQEPLPLATLLEIVRILIDEVAWSMADAVLAHILRHAPNAFPPLLYKAKLQFLRGDTAGARQTYRDVLANYPTSFDAISQLLDLVTPAEGREAIEAGLSHAPHGSEDRLRLLSLLVLQAERIGRISHGEPDHEAVSVRDLWPRYALAELRAYRDEASAQTAESVSAVALQHRASAEFGLRDAVQAEASFTRLEQMNVPGIAGAVNLKPSFYETLDSTSPAEVCQGLPPVVWISRPVNGLGHVYFLGADPVYMRDYGKAMVRSIGRNASGSQVHVHLMDATDEEVAHFTAWASNTLDPRISLSREMSLSSDDAQNGAVYYHSMRYVRFFQLLEQSRIPVTLLDVDGLMNRDFYTAVGRLGDFDLALSVLAGRLVPWESFVACAVSVRPTDRGLRYMKLVAAMIAHHCRTKTLCWWIDQLALRCCYDFLAARQIAPVLALLSERDVSRAANPDSSIWMEGGSKKKIALRATDANNGGANLSYIAAFRKFSEA